MSSTTLFVALVLAVAVLVTLGLKRAGLGGAAIVFVVLAYLVVPGVLAGRGMLDRYDPLPAPALLLLLGLSVLTAVLVFSSPGARLAVRVPLASVVALQAFRIAVEWLLHRFHVEGLVPVQMTYAGRNFDIVSGATGLVLGLWLLGGRPVSHGVLLAWNVLSLGLLLNIVTVAALSTPVPFRQFLEGPPNLLPSTLPYVWLPSFLVQLALASHLLVFRKLAQHRS
jgi:hypothetical protein